MVRRRPLRSNSGSTSGGPSEGGGYIPPVPMHKFTPASVEEAKKILAGRSEWFRIENGHLIDLKPLESPEQNQSMSEDVQELLSCGQNALTIRKTLEQKKEAHVQQLQAIDNDIKRATEALEKALAPQMEAYIAANALTPERKEEKLNDARKHLEELNYSPEQIEKYIASFPLDNDLTPHDKGQEYNRLKALSSENAALKALEHTKAHLKENQPDERMAARLSGFADYLEKELISHATEKDVLSYMESAKEKVAQLFTEKVFTEKGNNLDDFSDSADNISEAKAQMIAATLGLIVNTAKGNLEGNLSDHLHIRIRRKQKSALMEGFTESDWKDDYEYAKWWNPWSVSLGDRRELRMREIADDEAGKISQLDNDNPSDVIDSNLDYMAAHYQRFRIITGAAGPVLLEQLMKTKNPYAPPGWPEHKILYDSENGKEYDLPSILEWEDNRKADEVVRKMIGLGVSVRAYAQEKGIDLNRWSNRYPDMLKIVAQDDLAKGILGKSLDGVAVKDIAGFITSPWVNIAGKIDVKLSPQLQALIEERFAGNSLY